MLQSIFRKKSPQSAKTPIRSAVPSITQDTGVQHELLRRNQGWADQVVVQQPTIFEECAKGQQPKILWIGCADSRVPPEQIVSCAPGDIFVHRNIANVCIFSDLNSLSVVQYAVEVLKVEEIIVCGHYGCGGVKAAMGNQSYGMIDNWLSNIKSVYHKLEQSEQENLMVELNVANSVNVLCQTPILQNAWAQGQPITVHGWSYSFENGRIYDLNIQIASPNDIEKTDEYRYDLNKFVY
ncbi:carbonate dehydratase [Basidiobolus meristosporus CBS 931.73]|uniref:Carbonic anhydrase n=1 Tax=Basidiobolus meristosporus CBS 931.73 TaxID=1314790 RepID=A0A1Y1Z1D0_9FUNG|nr:carbonate dehydratase [Basidiobolus meristosporus CBS 931.73]|eukprot:ORY04098.1 carbonate dehydratase [Basidiobolus meristosporus CBS 931.73]